MIPRWLGITLCALWAFFFLPPPPQLWAQVNPTQGPVACLGNGTIASGGTAQILLAASQTRKFYQVQNLSTDPLAFSETTATPAVVTNGSWTLNPGTGTTAGGSYTSPPNYVPSSAIFIIGATTGDKFSCVTWG